MPKFSLNSLEPVRSVHFVGIKGVGMTAAALCAQDMGMRVTGSDVPQNFVTENILKVRRIQPIPTFDPANLTSDLDLVVFTGAHQGLKNPEVLAAQSRGITTISQAEFVGLLMQSKTGISVCGVGGKTSTSAMVATILDYAGLRPSFCIGVGQVLNLQVPGRIDAGPHFIAEADEYVVSPGTDQQARFLYQSPQYLICTNVAHDHPDAYSDLEATKQVFKTFFDRVPATGQLILNGNSGPLRQIDVSQNQVTWYGFTNANNDWWVNANFTGEGRQMVQIQSKMGETYQFTLSVPGRFNAQNALAAFLATRELGVKPSVIFEALQLFRGSMRRFEKVGERGSVVLYDDYAHHPSQIFATLEAARQWLPLYRIVAVFQPHTYSRTKVFLDQFAKSFTYADHVIITDIYASSREQTDPTISGQALAEAVAKHHPSVTYVPSDQLVGHLTANLKDHDALFTLGAGDIYQIQTQLKQ